MATKRPTEKNTKTEILSAFEELVKEKRALETQLATQSAKAFISPSVEAPRNGKPVSETETTSDSRSTNGEQGMESVIEELNRLQLTFGSAASNLSEKLVLEAFKLQEVQRSISEESQQLQTLHSLEMTDTSLDTLIDQYETSSKAFAGELQRRQETLAEIITQARKAWSKEQEERRRTIKDRNELLTRTRQRDSKEYTYGLTLNRKLSIEEYEQEKVCLYQELDEFQQTQERQWTEREKTVHDREIQFAELKTKVEAMPKELEAAIKRTREEGKGIANSQAKVKADLTAKEIEGQKRGYELRVNFLKETIEDQQSRIQTLSKQLDAALKQVQDLAVKAIEGAADVSSFNAVKEIALEQAKNQNKAK